MDVAEGSFVNTPTTKIAASGSAASVTLSDPGDGSTRSTRRSVARASSLNPPSVREKLDTNEFIVERVLCYRQINKVRHARVKWLGYTEMTWEPADQIFLYQPSQKKGHQVREVESLTKRRMKKGKVEYRVHWSGLPSTSDSWVRETVLARPDLVDKYLQEHALEIPVRDMQRMPRRKRNAAKADAILKSSEEMVFPTMITRQSDVPSEYSKNKIQSTKDGEAEEAVGIPRERPEVAKNAGISLFEAVMSADFATPMTSSTTAAPLDLTEETLMPSLSVLTEIPRKSAENKPVTEWTVSDVSEFLTQRGFTDAANKLQQRKVDGKEFLNFLDPAELRKLEIPVGHSLKIVKFVRDIRSSHVV